VDSSTGGGGAVVALLDTLGYVFAGYPASLDPAICSAH